MNVVLNYKDIQTHPVQIASNLAGAYVATSLIQTSSPPLRVASAGIGALLANYLYQNYLGNLDDAIRDPITGLAKAASDIASGHGSIFDYGLVGGAGYAGYSASSFLGGSGATVAAEGVEEAVETTSLLAELGAGALETVEMLAPLAILV